MFLSATTCGDPSDVRLCAVGHRNALVRDFGMEASPDDAGAKRAKTGARSLERLLLLLGLAGVTTTKVLECGVALYCEAHRRPSAFAQKYAARHISACLPH